MNTYQYAAHKGYFKCSGYNPEYNSLQNKRNAPTKHVILDKRTDSSNILGTPINGSRKPSRLA